MTSDVMTFVEETVTDPIGRDAHAEWFCSVSDCLALRLVRFDSGSQLGQLGAAYSLGFLGNGTLSYCINGLAEGRGPVLETRQVAESVPDVVTACDGLRG